jgi:hypothetical protein
VVDMAMAKIFALKLLNTLFIKIPPYFLKFMPLKTFSYK